VSGNGNAQPGSMQLSYHHGKPGLMQNAGHHQPSGSITGTNCNSRGAAGGREFGREITNANAQTGSVTG